MKPIMSGRHVYFRAVDESDFKFLYDHFNDFNDAYLWNNMIRDRSYEDFCDWLKGSLNKSLYFFYIISDNRTREKIGFIYSYDFHSNDAYAHVSIFIKEKYRKLYVAPEVGILYFDRLFKYHSFRKIYTEVYSYNIDSLNLMNSMKFDNEGILKKHKYYNGEYHDQYIFSMFREKFYDLHAKELEIFKDGGNNE